MALNPMPVSLFDRQKLTGEILGAIAAELKTSSRGTCPRGQRMIDSG
jgi:hypothetical protein